MVVLDAATGVVRVRIDAHAARLTIEPGDADRLLAAGWEMADARALRLAESELAAAGVSVAWFDAAGALARNVEAGFSFTDPGGNTVELFHSPLHADDPVRLHPEVGGFVTDDMGLGHVVLPAGDSDETFDFYINVLGFVHRDSMLVAPPGVVPYRMRFLACNPRHHSVALTQAKAPQGLRHVMFHMRDVIDVGKAFDRANHAGVLNTSIGQHSNDLMLSFYAAAPGGIDVEIATLGERHDNSTWRARELVAWKAWGYEQPKVAR
jgi:2,3-dihydroxybiphenyl 1,2-dioxygenase